MVSRPHELVLDALLLDEDGGVVVDAGVGGLHALDDPHDLGALDRLAAARVAVDARGGVAVARARRSGGEGERGGEESEGDGAELRCA
jgi:hypothetical protein